MTMEKLSDKAVKLIALDRGDTFAAYLMETLKAVTANAGWAGLLPAAVAEKAIETTICFTNRAAELQDEIRSRHKALTSLHNN